MLEQLTLEYWDSCAPSIRMQTAQALQQLLGVPWRFLAITTQSMGDQRHHVAFFDWNGAIFALVPGATVTLGYDRKHPYTPTEEQAKSWEETEQEYSWKLKDYLQHYMTKLRHVTIQPFLLEVRANIYDISPEVKKDGMVTKYMKSFTRDEALTHILSHDFRLPTSDEWEYACAAGSRTLFRWGDNCPMIWIPEETEQQPEWNLHLQPNAFGLYIGTYPYRWEFCAERGIMRGGDGGNKLHAGVGRFAEWLTLASAFHDRWKEELFDVYIRRALSLTHIGRL